MLEIKINGFHPRTESMMKCCASTCSTIKIEIPEHEAPARMLAEALEHLGFYPKTAEQIVDSDATITISRRYYKADMECMPARLCDKDDL